MEAKDKTEAPEGGGTKKDDEGDAGDAAGSRGFAPSLEHGHDSNDKDQNGGNGKSFQPHTRLLQAKLEMRTPDGRDFPH